MVEWNVYTREIRLVVNPTPNMSNDRCMNAFVDWYDSYGQHYDGRVVRSCRPGFSQQTDPGGDGHWVERDQDWNNVRIEQIGKAWGDVSDDDYVNGGFDVEHSDRLPATWRGGALDDSDVPRTCVDEWARVRTLYQNGTVGSCEMYPATEG